MPGSFLDFAKRMMENGSKSNNADSLGEMMPPSMGKPDGSIVGPGEYMKNKDITDGAITNDDGSISLDQSNPFVDALKKRMSAPAEQGTFRNFLTRIMGNQTDVGSATEFVAPSGKIDTANLNPTPMANQPQADLQPKKDYAVPTSLPLDALPQLRSSLLTGAGLDPAMYTPDGPEANTLAGRMNSPNSKAEINNQGNEAQDIADTLRNDYNSFSAGSPF